jgi:hypothetical protein
MVTQVGVANIVKYFADALSVGSGRVVMALTTFCFDISMLEVFLALTRGAAVLLALGSTQKDPFQIIHLLETHRVTVFQATPTTYEMLLAAGWTGDKSIDFLIGGEAFRSSVLPIANNCSSMRNVYGPTETTIWSSSFTIPTDVVAYCAKYGLVNALPIGEVISCTDFYVATDVSAAAGQGAGAGAGPAKWAEVAPGEEGELFIGGIGVAAGYLHAPELTVDRFFPSPFRQSDPPPASGDLIYRTGDVVRVLPDGNYLFLRRADAQVKIDGYRIELEEVEAAYKLADVEQAVVSVRHNKLVLYIKFCSAVSDPQSRLKSAHLEAGRTLTTYMRPRFTMLVDEFPTTPNGKLDKNRLPDPPELLSSLAVSAGPQAALGLGTGSASPPTATGEPTGEAAARCVSAIVCDIIQGYKGTRPPVSASLAAFGLDSLGAVLLIRQLKTALPGISIKLTEIFSPGVTISSLGDQLFTKASEEQRMQLKIIDESFAKSVEGGSDASLSPVDHFSDALAGNIRLVEGLRGVCTFMVLWNHWHDSQTPLSQAFNVDTFLFILISGYTTALQCRLSAAFTRGKGDTDTHTDTHTDTGTGQYTAVSGAEGQGVGDIELGGGAPGPAADNGDIDNSSKIQIVPRSKFALKSFIRTKAIGLFPILWLALILAIPMWIAQLHIFHDKDHPSNPPGDDIFGLCIGLYFCGMNEWAANCTNIVPHITYASSLWNILLFFGAFLYLWNRYARRLEQLVDFSELYRVTSGFTNPTVPIFFNNSRETWKHELGKFLLYVRFSWYNRSIFSFVLVTSIPVISGLFVLNAQAQLK